MRNPAKDTETERLASELVDAAFKVHQALGPGLLETVYEVCLTYLKLTGLGLGLLINFNVPLFKNGIKRFIR